jgi:hypothetical protein
MTIAALCAVTALASAATIDGVTTGVISAPAAAPALDTQVLWDSGELADHIFGGETLEYTTADLPPVTQAELQFKCGLWNSPDANLTVSLNGTELGSVVADQGYISPGPEYVTWDITHAIKVGANLISVTADGEGRRSLALSLSPVRGGRCMTGAPPPKKEPLPPDLHQDRIRSPHRETDLPSLTTGPLEARPRCGVGSSGVAAWIINHRACCKSPEIARRFS